MSTCSSTAQLPIDAILPALSAALENRPNAILQAAPGAGKTTRVPLALKDAHFLAGRRLLMLEPRRLAARAAAARMAASLGESIGQTVGYRIRGETRVSKQTRIEVVTEAILTRLLQTDQALADYGLIIFDEQHERNLHTDLGLALCLDVQENLRPDLRLLVMSATLEMDPLSKLISDATLLTCPGRTFPIQIHYLAANPKLPLEGRVGTAIEHALNHDDGSLLVFLPGSAEIRRQMAWLEAHGLTQQASIHPLYGNLPPTQQDAAIAPAPPGQRKIVLATAIAETSLTIDGIRVVIDAGLSRDARFSPRTGMTHLETGPVSRAAAEQRAGRAGRLMPGICYRLWSEQAHAQLPAYAEPEILHTDLAPLALELARWSVTNPSNLRWLNAPPAAAYARARELLIQLEALDPQGRLTTHGQTMSQLGVHPRLAHMLLKASTDDATRQACELAAVLSERDLAIATDKQRPSIDIESRLALLRGDPIPGLAPRQSSLNNARNLAQDLQRQLSKLAIDPHAQKTLRLTDDISSGALLALAYPDRIAQQRQTGSYRLSNGRGATLPTTDPLAHQPFLVAAELEGGKDNATIRLAAAISLGEIRQFMKHRLVIKNEVTFDPATRAVQARRREYLDALVLTDTPLPAPAQEQVRAALIEGIRELGLSILPWDKIGQQWRARLDLAYRLDSEAGLPNADDTSLLATLEDWLGPYLSGLSSLSNLSSHHLNEGLQNLLTWTQRQQLDALLPSHLSVPSGSRLAIDYSQSSPVLAVRLQEMLGCKETPTVAHGRLKITLHLLSPGRQPLAVTQDLPNFWQHVYPQVRKEMRGAYPKHYWPENPLDADPTTQTKRQMQREGKDVK